MINIKGLIIYVILIICIALPYSVTAKTKVSGPEFAWALAHPFIAIKAKKISKRVIYITDSLEAAGVLKDRSGGQLDAFKHAFWMASLSQQIKKKKAYKLGLAHEKFNHRQAKKGKGGGDQAASDMDLWNNKVGVNLGYDNRQLSESALIELVIKWVLQGEMRMIKKDAQGNSLDSSGQLIDKSTLKTWVNKRCLVPSDYRYN